jgi:hypothetical protein
VPAVDAVDFDFELAVPADWMSDDLETFAGADVRSALDKIESTLSSNSSWSDDKARAARSYIGPHLSDFLELFSASPDLSAKSPRVWQEVLRLQRQSPEVAGAAAEASKQAAKVLRLLNSLPDEVLAMMADALSDWMASWVESLKTDPLFAVLWLRAWPAAVAVTNQRTPPEDEDISGLFGDSESDQGERLETAALNTPVGHMMTAFLGMLPRSLKEPPHPFASDPLRRMRDAAAGAEGQARLQVLYRFLSHLEYMRHADQEWTDRSLLNPLNNAGTAEIEIWNVTFSVTTRCW